MNRRTLLVSIIFLYCSIHEAIQSQTIGAELSKIRNAYLEATHLSFDVVVYSYSSKTDATAELISTGFMKKSDDMYYSNINNYELLIMGERALIVDRERKTLDYYEYKIDKQLMTNAYQVNIDSILTYSDSIVIRPSENGLKHFSCFSKNGYIRQTEFYVDTKSNFVKRILYYYVESSEDYEIEVDRVEIFYKNIKTSNVDQQHFNFDKYFRKSGSTLSAIGAYSKYELNFHSS